MSTRSSLCSSRFPYTTLFRSLFAAGLGATWLATVAPTAAIVGKLFGTRYLSTLFGLTLLSHQVGAFFGAWRSEEHTSELQSRENLVCRLLLEKYNQFTYADVL